MKKLLIVTQVVDTEDPVLGFFVGWLQEFAKHIEHIEVICLRKGSYNLPTNVRVHSLGKEKGSTSRVIYIHRFLTLIWSLRHEYEAVFVHMNQEYVLLAGWLWRLLGKRVYLWRNHYAGSWLTDLAAAFCATVFCTSKHSYTAKYAKTVLMPVGVDTERFKPSAQVARETHSILFLSRISPSKRVDLFISALLDLAHEGIAFTATIVGSPLPEDREYYENLQEKLGSFDVSHQVSFLPAVPNHETPVLYQSHEIFVNASPSGMLDKTLFEAAACGCCVLASSRDFADSAGAASYFDSSDTLADRLRVALANPQPPTTGLVEANSLEALSKKLVHAL